MAKSLKRLLICTFIMKNTIKYAFLLAIAALGCKGTSAQKIENTDAQGFQDKMKTVSEKIILDVRTPQEYENGHIPGAININIYDEQFQTKLASLDSNKTVFVYCLAGGRSASASDILVESGFQHVVNLSKGYSQWNGQGFPVEMGAQAAVPAKGMTADEFKSITNHGDTLVLVDFNAKWCTPCKKIAVILAELEKEYAGKVAIHTVDYDQNSEIIKSQKVTTVPTVRLYKNGNQVWNHEGAIEKQALVDAIQAHQ